MLHKFIVTLRAQLPLNQWLFLLTTYELGKHGWISRQDVVNAAQIPVHSSQVSRLSSELQNIGLLDVRTAPNSVNQGSIEVKLTPKGKQFIREAFEGANGSAGTRAKAPATLATN
jgi:DNA-binding MarR family transcriptional regulator